MKSKKKYISAAMRGRYLPDGRTAQNLELRSEKYTNALTTVQKDTLIVEVWDDINKKEDAENGKR